MEDKHANSPAPPLQIRLFGPFDVWLDGRPLPRLRSHKEQWLLALLVLRAERPVERDWLAGTLWPESSQSQAAYNLRRSLSNLRQTLGDQASRLLSPNVHTVQMDLSGAEVDMLRFDRAVKDEETVALEAAIALYRGPLLEGCTEEWVFPERQAREQAYLSTLEKRAAQALTLGEPKTAVMYLKRAIVLEPLRQTMQRALMQALAASGDSAEAIRVYRELRLLLRQELNSDPDPETVALFQKIRAEARDQTQPAPVTAVVRAVVPSRPSVHLPSPITSLVGREQEIAEISACLQSARLITLTGMGGVGKTRLAIEVARWMTEDYGDGVWFVDLAPLSEPTLLAPAVASVFGLREEGKRTLDEALGDHLREMQALLVLDNCEHLVAACAELTDRLLQGCARLRILATSRQALGLIGEVVFPVPSLALPPLKTASPRVSERMHPAAQEELVLVMQYEAPRLFEERARQALPAFRITSNNVQAVGQICHHLDGIPLAIELAAARVKALSIEQIAGRLGDRFQLLAMGSRTALPRQQTLRDLVEWSYNLLTPQEQALLRRLVVFAGGWTLEAAEQVAGEREEGKVEAPVPSLEPSESLVPVEDVLDLLFGLVEKSLVVYEEDGEAHYRLLETVSQYAWEKLLESGEEPMMRKRHLDFFLRLAEEAEGCLYGPEQARWLMRLEREHGNLRAALAFDAAEEEIREFRLRLAGALWKFWETRGHLTEGRAHLARALARPAALEPSTGEQIRSAARAKAFYAAAGLALRQGDLDTARALFERSLAIRRKRGDMRGTADTLNSLGVVALQQGDFVAARSLMAQSLAIQRELGERRGIANALNNMGLVLYYQGDYAHAQFHYEESLAIHRERGDGLGIANALDNLGNVAYEQGDYAAARDLFEQSYLLEKELGHQRGMASVLYHLGDLACSQEEFETAWTLHTESLAIRQELGDKPGIALSLQHLGEVALARDDYPSAEEHLMQSLRLYRQIGNPRGCVDTLGCLARLREAQGQREQSACLLGAVGALQKEVLAPPSHQKRSRYDQCVAIVRGRMGEEAVAAAWAQGQTLSLEEAIACALNATAWKNTAQA